MTSYNDNLRIMDNNQVYIYLKNKGYLELSDEFPVPLTYNIADVKDISSKNGSYSKTIKIPGTKANNELLGHLFNINIADSTFDINRKVECVITANDIVVMDGYFKLTQVDKRAATQSDDEEVLYYNALVFDETTNFYDKLGDALLEDLDFSQYNHIYSASTILGSSAHTSADIWTYPMFYNGDGSSYYEIDDFYPAIYAKAYVDKIFQNSEYSYESDFFQGTSYEGLFTKLIIPFNQERPQNTQEVIDGRKFRASITGATDPIILSGLAASTTISELLTYNDDSSAPNFDNGNDYSASTSTYISSNNQITDFRVRFPASFKVYSDSGVTITNSQGVAPLFSNAASNNYVYKPKVGIFVNGVQQSAINIVPGVGISAGVTLPNTLSPGVTTIVEYNVDVTFTNIQLSIGDEVQVRLLPTLTPPSNSSGFILGTTSLDYYRYYSGSTQVDPYYYVEIDINSSADTLSFINQPHQTDITDGDTIYLNNYIPKNVKQKDFFRSIVQMFNLYIEADKDNDNKLIIKTRDEFYDTNDFVDWTEKFAIDRPNDIKFLPELQNRDLILSYKSGSDVWNKRYQENWKENFGRKKYIFDNDYLKGERKIEVIFEPTPLIENGIGLITPSIPSEAPKTGIKILYKPDEWIEGSWDFKARDNSNQVVTYSLSGYPYAGHFDRPTSPNVDINFGEAREMFYWQYGLITDNNLSNRFYDSYVQGIIDGKMFTGFFDLNEVDITNLDFSRKIFVDDTYYLLNKIIDFNPMTNELTKVELIKIDTGIKFNTTNTFTGGTVRPVIDVPAGPIIDFVPNNPNNPGPVRPWTTTNWPRKTKGDVIGNGNISNNNTSVDIVGDNNTIIGEGDGIIYGDNNYMFSERMFIYGNNNTATADTYYRSFIVGDNNVVEAQKTVIFGDNFTATTDNRTYIESLEVRGTIVSGFLDVSGATITGLEYLPLSGGVMTGGITGTTLQLTGLTSGAGVASVQIDANGNFITGTTSGGQDVYISGDSGSYSIKANNPFAVASADYAFAGGSSTASTVYAVSLGSINTASGEAAFAMGTSNTASGNYSFARGSDNIASGAHSQAQGKSNIASGITSTCEGFGNAAGNYAHAQGQNTKATGDFAHSGGELTNASGNHSFVHGYLNSVTAARSVVLGGQNITGTTNDTVYVPGLNIRDIGAGTPIINLGLDANGFVVTGTTGGGSAFWEAGTGTGALQATPGTLTTNGNYSFIAGGNSNIIQTNSHNSALIGGTGNTIADSEFAILLGGMLNLVDDISDYSGVIGGNNNSVANTSSSSLIIGGTGNTISGADRAIILGGHNLTATTNDTVYVSNIVGAPYDLTFAVSDETTAITTGTDKIALYAPRGFEVSKVKVSLTTTGSTTTTVDVNVGGTTILTSPISLTSGVYVNSTTGIATSSISEDDRITVDIDAAGTDAKGLKIYLIGKNNN